MIALALIGDGHEPNHRISERRLLPPYNNHLGFQFKPMKYIQ